MSKKTLIKLGIALLLLASTSITTTVLGRGRNELHRYTLLRDRSIIDREIKHGLYSSRHEHFFNLDIILADGMREMINDISNGIDNADNKAQRTINVLNTLNKNMNSEKFVDLDASLGVPLPYIKIDKFHFLPSLFASQNFGIMTSVDNQNDPTNPKAQIYFKTDTKYGLSTRFKWRDDHEFRASLYRIIRSDLFVERTSDEIVDQGDLADFGELSNEVKTYGIDFSYLKTNGDSTYLLEVLELFPSKALDSNTNATYDMKPMFHGRYSRKTTSGIWQWHPFVGVHYRQHYDVLETLYAGTTLKFDHDNFPFHFAFKMSSQFLGFMPSFVTDYFHLSYSFKTPYINPQDDIWVSAHHSLNLRFPFP